MKLTKRLFIGNQEYDLASHKVSLKLSLGGKAILIVNADEAPKRLELVRFDIGYEQQTALLSSRSKNSPVSCQNRSL